MNKRRVLSLILAILMVMTLLPTSALAASKGKTANVQASVKIGGKTVKVALSKVPSGTKLKLTEPKKSDYKKAVDKAVSGKYDVVLAVKASVSPSLKKEVKATITASAVNGKKAEDLKLFRVSNGKAKEIKIGSVSGKELTFNAKSFGILVLVKVAPPAPTPTAAPQPTDPPAAPPAPPADPVEPPVDPTEPPVDPTEPPVDPTEPPVDPTEPPVDPTEPPVDPTEPPVDPTEPPVDPTEPPVDPTEPPVDPTEPPVDPTEPPVDPTEPPVDPTEPPVDPTEPPVDPTEPPVDPTEPPVDPTEPPVDPTEPPVDPTEPPVDPTEPPALPAPIEETLGEGEDAVTVTVTGAPEGTTLTLAAANAEADAAALALVLTDGYESKLALDIAMEPDEFDEPVTVSVSAPALAGLSAEGLTLYHIKNGAAEEVAFTLVDGVLTFASTSFSPFELVQANAPTDPPTTTEEPVGADPEPTRAAGMITVNSSSSNIVIPTGDDTYEYNLQTETTGTITMVYTPPSSGTSNTILVLTWPAYAALRNTAPTIGINHIADIKYPSGTENIAVIKVDDNVTEQFQIQFTIKTTGLTNAQAAALMDETAALTNYSATEYTYSGSNILDYAEGTMGAHFESAPMYPAVYDVTSMTPVHEYEVAVSTIPAVTNTILNTVNASFFVHNQAAGYGFSPWVYGALYYNIPSVHTASGSAAQDLIEIKSIRVNVPKEFKLTSLANIVVDANTPHDPYDQQWNGWTVSAEQAVEEGGEVQYYTYTITPAGGARWFNTGVSRDITDTMYAVGLRLQMRDSSVPLTPDTVYTAPNPVVTYRHVGDTEDSTLTNPSELIVRTWKAATVSPNTAFNPIRYKNRSPEYQMEVNVDSFHFYYDEWATAFCNQYYFTGGATQNKTEYKLVYEGPLTQKYEFPEDIQPRKIVLREGSGRFCQGYGRLAGYSSVVLDSIVYKTEDGVTHTVPASTISSLNSSFSGTDKAFADCPMLEIPLDGWAADNRVTEISVNWASLFSRYKFAYSQTYPIRNGSNGNLSSAVSGVSAYSNDCLMLTYFDYYVADKDKPSGTKVQTQYTVTYTGENAPANNSYSDFLWYKLVKQPCPDLIGTGGKAYTSATYANNGTISSIGNVGIDIQHWGDRRDEVLNPVIDFTMYLHIDGWQNNTYKAEWYANHSNITPETNAWAFFNGKFTAQPKLSGWVVTYTTHKYPGGKTYPLPESIPEGGTPITLPLESDDWFTGMSMHYDGTVIFEHSHEEDERTEWLLMTNIQIRKLKVDPNTGLPVTMSNTDTALLCVTMDGYLSMDNCTCDTVNGHKSHEKTATWPGQRMLRRLIYNSQNVIPHGWIWYQRQARFGTGKYTNSLFTVSNGLVTKFNGTSYAPADVQLAQGSSKYMSFLPDLSLDGVGGTMDGSLTTPTNNAGVFTRFRYWDAGLSESEGKQGYFPWDIRFAVYVELLDTNNFQVDYSKTKLYNVAATNANVIHEIITVTDSGGETHKFLKLQFAEGYRHSVFASLNPPSFTTVNGTNYFVIRDGRWCQFSNIMNIGLYALPSAEEGDHWPIGRVYFDYSELLDKYDSPAYETGYDGNKTNYLFSNAVADPYDLHSHTEGCYTGHTAAETNRLFMVNFSQNGPTPVKFNVTKAAVVGASHIPGKQENWDAMTLVTEFTPDLREELNSLVSIVGSASQTTFDYHTYIVLPRNGKEITYIDDSGTVATCTGELDLFLRGEAALLFDNTDDAVLIEDDPTLPDDYHHTVTIKYTTAENPGADSTWVDASAVTDWDAVTGIEVWIDRMSVEASMSLRLDLQTDPKTSLAIPKAYSGGHYSYRVGSAGAEPSEAPMNRITWIYNNIKVTGHTFWDMHDENGRQGTTASGTAYLTTGDAHLPGLAVNIKDPDGNVIQQLDTDGNPVDVVTNASGDFTLWTYLDDADQTVTIAFPEEEDVTVYLTAKINSNPRTSKYDSDFERKTTSDEYVTGTLSMTLPALTASGFANLSAGFVKLPQPSAEEVSVAVGDTANVIGTLKEFFRTALPSTSYNLTFAPLAEAIEIGGTSYEPTDTTIATITETTLTLTTADSGEVQIISDDTTTAADIVTGVAVGYTWAKVTTTNKLGDEVVNVFKITVTPNDFYIYHSLTGTMEAVSMTECDPTTGKYDLVAKVDPNGRYGGYYSASGAATLENFEAATDAASAATPNASGIRSVEVTDAVIYSGNAVKNGSTRFWTKANAASSAHSDPAYTEIGTAMTPVRGNVYYLKEVPNKYLLTLTRYVYNHTDDTLAYLYFLTDVDDTFYSSVYVDVATDHGTYPCRLASSFSYTQRGTTTITVAVTPGDFHTDVVRGYVGTADASALLSPLTTGTLGITPGWTTLDGVDVAGDGYDITLGDGTVDDDTGIRKLS